MFCPKCRPVSPQSTRAMDSAPAEPNRTYIRLEITTVADSALRHSPCKQGRGNYFEVGRGGQTSPGVKGNLPKTKYSRIWPTIFWGGIKVHVQKQTKIQMNDIHSPKLGGGGETLPKLPSWGGGKLRPLHPPPPMAPASLISWLKIPIIRGKSSGDSTLAAGHKGIIISSMPGSQVGKA